MVEGSRIRRPDGRHEEEHESRAAAPPQNVVLALQRSAGNRATGAALQRFWVKKGTSYSWKSNDALKPNYLQTSETHESWIPRRKPSAVYVPKPGLNDEMLGGWDEERPAIAASLLTDLQTVAATTQGAGLLAKLAAARHKTEIQPSPVPLMSGPVTDSPMGAKYDPSNPKKGAPATVRLQPGIAVDAADLGLDAVQGEHQDSAWNPTPSDVLLFHELVHSYHRTRGKNASGKLSAAQAIHAGDESVSISEYQCTGLDTADGSAATQFSGGDFTENKYRQERGIAHRDTYIPRGYRVPAAEPLLF